MTATPSQRRKASRPVVIAAASARPGPMALWSDCKRRTSSGSVADSVASMAHHAVVAGAHDEVDLAVPERWRRQCTVTRAR